MTKLFEEIDTKQIKYTVVNDSSIKAVDGEDKDGEKVFKIVISTNQVDRYGEIVNQDGIDFTNYLKNPIVLWGHDYYLPPIGKTIELIKQKTKTIAKFVFATTQFAQEIKSLVEGGFVNMSSIGFISQDFDRDKNVHNVSELLEFSLVDVPANPGAGMQRSVMIKSMAQGIKELNCKEVEAYVCKKGDDGCKICSKIIEQIKLLEQKDLENEEIKPETDDLSEEKEKDNKDIKEEEKEVKNEEKIFYDCRDLDLEILKEIEKVPEDLEEKIKGKIEITEEEKTYLDLICELVLCIKKKSDIIEEVAEEKSKAEKPLNEKINQLDEKIKEILSKNKAEEEDKDQTNQLIKLASKSLNLALSNYNKNNK